MMPNVSMALWYTWAFKRGSDIRALGKVQLLGAFCDGHCSLVVGVLFARKAAVEDVSVRVGFDHLPPTAKTTAKLVAPHVCTQQPMREPSHAGRDPGRALICCGLALSPEGPSTLYLSFLVPKTIL